MCTVFVFFFFFFIATSSTVIYTLSLHDALPICIWFHSRHDWLLQGADSARRHAGGRARHDIGGGGELGADYRGGHVYDEAFAISVRQDFLIPEAVHAKLQAGFLSDAYRICRYNYELA